MRRSLIPKIEKFWASAMRQKFFEKMLIVYHQIPHLHETYTRSVTAPMSELGASTLSIEARPTKLIWDVDTKKFVFPDFPG